MLKIAILCTVTLLCAAGSIKTVYASDEEGAGYIGSKKCLACHKEYDKAILKTNHAILFSDPEKHEAKKGCESCHGPGEGHLEDPEEGITRFGDLAPAEASAICLGCHNSDGMKSWQISQHALDGMACNDCHSPHGRTAETYKGKEKPEKLLVDEKIQLCLSCHQSKLADINLPSHHPVREGKVSCSDCHSSHANSLLEMDRVDKKCVNCHQEKAGPFLYEHTPAAESCLACHASHGSINQNLLTLRQPALCLQCHINTPGSPNGHDTAGTFKTCTNCHTDIHGSNKEEHYCNSVFGCPYP
ncbi:MAG: DmsE family decaheme c-type cytochrome [bacterium]